MSEQIIPILEILLKVSNSISCYLLRMNRLNYEVVALTGEDNGVYDEFNTSLFDLYISKQLSYENAKSLQTYKLMVDKLSINSLYIKLLTADETKTDIFYLVLLSNSINNYNAANVGKFSQLIDELNNKIKSINHIAEAKKPKKKVNKSEDLIHRMKLCEDKLNMFMETSEDMVFILDKYGTISEINNFGAAMLNYQTDELKGRHFIELISAKDKPLVSDAFQRLLSEHKFMSVEASLLSKYDNHIIFEFNGETLIEKGKIAGVLGVGKNITQLRSYENQIQDLNTKLIEARRLISIERNRSKHQKSFLDDLNRLKSEFVSNISHELRTPLASIIGFSETILSDPNMQNDMKIEFNEIIFNEGKRLAKLVEDVLDVSKIEGGEIELEKRELNIVDLLNEVIEENRPNFEKKKITLTTEITSDEVKVNADKIRIKQVFDGLLNNAIKFTNIGGRITLFAQNLFREFEIILSDTGSGIPEKDLPYIFEKFYRVSRPGIELPGTGLGLVFVKQIIDLHKGFISVESEVNKGTTFIIKLPKGIKG